MRSGLKTFTGALTALAVILLLTGCGLVSPMSGEGTQNMQGQDAEAQESPQNENEGQEQGYTAASENEEERLTILADDTFLAGIADKTAFLKAMEEQSGIAVQVIQAGPEEYYELAEQTLEGEDWPDLILLDSVHYAEYAQRGVLWDMTASYDRASWKERVIDPQRVESYKLYGNLYGLAPFCDGAYVTYVRKSWLDNCDLAIPQNEMDFLEMCSAFRKGDPDGSGAVKDTYALTAPGIIGRSLPYTGYLPEIFLDAVFGFYQDEEGVWKDGFTEDAMRDALWRLQSCLREGYLDPDILNGTFTESCRKFLRGECGAITVPAGYQTAEETIGTKLEEEIASGEVIMLAPLKELAAYRLRQPSFWCITTACEDPQTAFGFISAMVEENAGEENAFLMLGENGTDSVPAWKDYAQSLPLLPFTEEMSRYYDDLTELKREIVLRVASGEVTVREGMEEFQQSEGAEWSRQIVDSLNR